ncbi:hypothetical protein [Gelidibacter japonicus]|uniref:hypothetical protein n=1 Tax=Gelidibacter japonicus TaxID=1962232 RepID=UPI002AFF786D|nr:hypothetical protein [Gelidibacter japonicus]
MNETIFKASLQSGDFNDNTLTFLLDDQLKRIRVGEYAIINLSKLSLIQAVKLDQFILNELQL